MTGRLTIGDWAYIFGFTFLIVFMIYLSRKEQQAIANNQTSTGNQES